MTGIGDEIGAHFLDASQRRQIAKGQQHEVGAARIGRALDRHSHSLEPAVERNPLGIFDALLFAARAGAIDRLGQFRHAQRQGDRLALAQRRRQHARRFVKRNHAAIAVERDDRIGQTQDYGVQRIATALGRRQNRRNPSACLTDAHRHQRGSRDDCKTCERVMSGKGTGRRQAGEHERRRDDDQPRTAPQRPGAKRTIVNQTHRQAHAARR